MFNNLNLATRYTDYLIVGSIFMVIQLLLSHFSSLHDDSLNKLAGLITQVENDVVETFFFAVVLLLLGLIIDSLGAMFYFNELKIFRRHMSRVKEGLLERDLGVEFQQALQAVEESFEGNTALKVYKHVKAYQDYQIVQNALLFRALSQEGGMADLVQNSMRSWRISRSLFVILIFASIQIYYYTESSYIVLAIILILFNVVIARTNYRNYINTMTNTVLKHR